MPLGRGDLQREGAWALGGTNDDYELAIEEFHGRLLEALQTGGIAIADGLEGTCACNLERQLIAGIGDERSFGIGERNGDEGHIVAMQSYVKERDCGVFFKDLDDLVSQLKDKSIIKRLNKNVMMHRMESSFDYHLPELIDFFRKTIHNGFARV